LSLGSPSDDPDRNKPNEDFPTFNSVSLQPLSFFIHFFSASKQYHLSRNSTLATTQNNRRSPPPTVASKSAGRRGAGASIDAVTKHVRGVPPHKLPRVNIRRRVQMHTRHSAKSSALGCTLFRRGRGRSALRGRPFKKIPPFARNNLNGLVERRREAAAPTNRPRPRSCSATLVFLLIFALLSHSRAHPAPPRLGGKAGKINNKTRVARKVEKHSQASTGQRGKRQTRLPWQKKHNAMFIRACQERTRHQQKARPHTVPQREEAGSYHYTTPKRHRTRPNTTQACRCPRSL